MFFFEHDLKQTYFWCFPFNMRGFNIVGKFWLKTGKLNFSDKQFSSNVYNRLLSRKSVCPRIQYKKKETIYHFVPENLILLFIIYTDLWPFGSFLQTDHKSLKHPPWKNSCQKMFTVSPCKMFAASILQNVCSFDSAKCLQHPHCKMFAASTLQNVCSIHSMKCLQHLLYKMFAAYNL